MNPRKLHGQASAMVAVLSVTLLASCSSVSLTPAPVVDRSTSVDPSPAPVSPVPPAVEASVPAPAHVPAPAAEVIDRSTPAAGSSANTTATPVYPSAPPAGRQTTYPYSTDGSYQGEMIGTPTPGSPFSKVRIGMTFQRVQDLIGAPQRVYTRQTGKAWIPFYYGNDSSRIIGLFPGEGCLTFTGGNKLGYGANELIIIEVDPSGACYQP